MAARRPLSAASSLIGQRFCRADKVLLGGGVALLGGTAVFGASLLGAGLPASVLGLLITDGVFRPSSSTFYPTTSHGPRNQPQVALTFDDGPDPQVTPLLLDTLAATGARATFFTIGRHLARNIALAERALREGHELGNHSWQHDRLQNFYGTRALLDDIDRNTRLIRHLARSDRTPLYRPPIGLKSPALARAAHQRGLQVIAWSLHSRDTLLRDPQRIAERTLMRVKAGDIILMHDGHDRDDRHRGATAAALPLILSGLAQRGLQSVTVSELLGHAVHDSSALARTA
jgi:peptidoglycan/xylan/chitin deacetylase (PgdA/CDA1 family)